jgi:hypothetical protein
MATKKEGRWQNKLINNKIEFNNAYSDPYWCQACCDRFGDEWEVNGHIRMAYHKDNVLNFDSVVIARKELKKRKEEETKRRNEYDAMVRECCDAKDQFFYTWTFENGEIATFP